MVNYGIAYGLSAFGLADRLQISREEAAVYIDRYFERFPAVKTFIDETIAERGEAWLRDHPDGPPPQHPRAALLAAAAPPARRAARGQHRDPGHRRGHHQGGDGALASSAGRGRARDELVLQIHDELLFEGPTGEIEAATEIAEREMVGAFELDPPLAVDTGVGPDWLAAK